MNPSMTLAFVMTVVAAPANAFPPDRTSPELEAKGIHASQGFCGTLAYSSALELPSIPIPTDRAIPDDYKKRLQDAQRQARARLVAARRLTDRMHRDLDEIVVATNECPDAVWEKLAALRATAEGSARDVAAAELSRWLPKEQPISWADASGLPAPPSFAPAADDRYAGACRVPSVDTVLFAPSGPGLPASARAKLTTVETDAAAVTRALTDQKLAVDELARLSDGARCRELLQAFDALVSEERSLFVDYREKAVAGAVWNELTWKAVTPAAKSP